MGRLAPTDAPQGRYGTEEYFALVTRGILAPDDRVELLEGLVVSMAPQSARHAAVVSRVREVLVAAVERRATVREEKPLILGASSVPEPDVALVPGTTAHYARAHPREAFLVVEVADSSLVQDRLTKAAIYAAAAIPEYWIVDLRSDTVDVRRAPDARARRYRDCHVRRPGDRLTIVALPDTSVAVADLLLPES